LGVELEHSSIKYYSEKLEKASDKSERAFLEKMLEEEKGHLSALLDLKMFLEDPADWHMKKERHLPS
jgi:rubrerythrin